METADFTLGLVDAEKGIADARIGLGGVIAP
jgi:hypothetical protein